MTTDERLLFFLAAFMGPRGRRPRFFFVVSRQARMAFAIDVSQAKRQRLRSRVVGLRSVSTASLAL
jgi:hypothetical protein